MTYDKTSTPDLVKEVEGLAKREFSDRRTMLEAWMGLGERLGELRERHVRGLLGKGTWAQWCSRHGFVRKWAERWIEVARADDPATRLDQILLHEAKMGRTDKTEKRGPHSIIVKRPGVIFGYLTDLNDQGKREFFALCVRNYPKMLRQVWDDIGTDDDDRPSLHA